MERGESVRARHGHGHRGRRSRQEGRRGYEILDVAGKVDYADFLVVMTGRSDRHAHALAQGIEEAMKARGLRPVAVEGLPHGSWVLMDFGDVVVHVFMHESRELYDIDGLWLDARRLPVPGSSETE